MNCQEHTDKQANLVFIVSSLTVLKFITTCRSLNQIQDPEAVSQVIFSLTLQEQCFATTTSALKDVMFRPCVSPIIRTTQKAGMDLMNFAVDNHHQNISLELDDTW